jgi:hypothetical protein
MKAFMKNSEKLKTTIVINTNLKFSISQESRAEIKNREIAYIFFLGPRIIIEYLIN